MRVFCYSIFIFCFLYVSATKIHTEAANKKVSFETQVKTFKSLGFKLNKGVSEKEFLKSYSRSEFEIKNPYALLYYVWGSDVEREPYNPRSNDLLWFDTECIEDHGDYSKIVKNLARITKGELPMTDVHDFVDIDAEKAWVAFRLKGKSYKWKMRVQDDWVDAELFTKIIQLTKDLNTKRRFTYYSDGGQDLVIGWLTSNELEKLKKATGLKVDWLN